jgi:hypothetical protein
LRSATNLKPRGYQGVLNILLEDNGGITCSFQAVINAASEAGLACNPEYAATFDLSSGIVSYVTPFGFAGTFATSKTTEGDGSPFDPLNTFWTASVFGC